MKFWARKPVLFPAAAPSLLAALLYVASAVISHAQLSPGPYEILPFDDAFIIEAFKDLQTNVSGSISDWSGWSGSAWVSPDAYDDHIGSDFSAQTGTPLHAITVGTVSQIATGFPQNNHSTYGGNFVKIAADGLAPSGEALDLSTLHMLSVAVSVGQRVNVGDFIGLSDNTGNSTSEHVHIQSDIRANSMPTCPFYWAHFKYPIMFNAAGTIQVGRIVRITAISTPIRTDRYDSSSQISLAWQNQLYFCSYPKRGYYQVFIPNTSSYRSGWIKATDAQEVFTGTVIQALPDPVAFSQSGTLSAPYPIRSSASDSAGQVAQIVFGGGRFVADQFSNGYYRVPVPGASPTWGWVKPTNRMVVYPQLYNPAINLATLPNNNFPIAESFAVATNKPMFGRPKFNRSVVKAFSPASPGGDGKALFMTDVTNFGDGTSESVSAGKQSHRDYYVQCDVYFNYRPAYVVADGGWERFGVFLRDDGFAGLDTTFEGAGNAYVFLWDADDGRLRAGKVVDGAITDFFSPVKYVNSASAWHTMRIEARGSQIKYFLDGVLQIQVTDTAFASGLCGIGYVNHFNGNPAARGAYFDNFIADSLLTAPRFTSVSLKPDGKVHLQLNSDLSTTNIVERATTLTNWNFFTNVINTSATMEFSDDTNAPARIYRAKRLP